MTHDLLSAARWRGQDPFPAWQEWANDVEAVLEFLALQNRLPTFLGMIQRVRSAQHRDALLAEARGAFHLHRHGFRILEWEPLGEGTSRGEVLVGLASSPDVFVEVKQPSWQGVFAVDDHGSEPAL